jgi:hypothetical protein
MGKVVGSDGEWVQAARGSAGDRAAPRPDERSEEGAISAAGRGSGRR